MNNNKKTINFNETDLFELYQNNIGNANNGITVTKYLAE